MSVIFLIEAIRYGEQPEVRARLEQAIDGALDIEHLQDILRRNALVEQQMTLADLYTVKEEMEKAEARKLQPYFIRAFFSEAFQRLNGEIRQRESGRYEIKHVPAEIRERDRTIGESRTPVLKKYARICFEKQYVRQYNRPMAELIHPAHPLMHSVTDLILSVHRSKLKQGSVLIDPHDDSTEPKVLFMIDHSVREGAADKQRIASRRLQFVQIDSQGQAVNAGWAPHLDLVPLSKQEASLIEGVLNSSWLNASLEAQALQYASTHLAAAHYQEVKFRRQQQADKIEAAVQERLVKEINYWGDRYIKLQMDLEAGKQPRMQPENARRRNEELGARLEQRKKELAAMRDVVSNTPVVMGGALVIPAGLLALRKGDQQFSVDAQARRRIEIRATQAVIQAEEALGHQVFDVSDQKCGWDLTARPPLKNGKILPDRHIEIKGRAKGVDTITVTRNEIMYALNQADQFLLAIVLIDGEEAEGPYYVRQPFKQEPEFAVTSVNYQLRELLKQALTAEASL